MGELQLGLLPDNDEVLRFRSIMLDHFEWSPEFMNGVCELGIMSLNKPGAGISHRGAKRMFKMLEAREITSVIEQVEVWKEQSAFYAPKKVLQMLMGRSGWQNQEFRKSNKGLWAMGHYCRLLRGGHEHDVPCVYTAHLFPDDSWEGKGMTSIAPCATGVKIAEAVVIGYMCKAFLTATSMIDDL